MRLPPTTATLTEQAAHWHALHREDALSAAEKRAFMAWLVVTPSHLREYLAMGQISSSLADALADEDVDALLASPADTGSNVVAMPLAERGTQRQRAAAAAAPKRSRRPAWALAACAALISIGVGGWFLASTTAQYSAPHGQPQQWTLADGSTLQLDADSAVSLYFTPLRRRVDVQRGRAAFMVAEARRPFEVQAAGLRVRDIGTTFSVSLQREQARIDVLEGRVQVRAEADPTLLADLVAGQSARIAYRDHRVELRQEQAAAINGWWQGRIAFHDEALRDVVDQFNRRNTQQVVLEDAQAGALRLSGNLRAEGVDALAAYLRTQPALDVRTDGGQIHVRTRR